MKWDKDTYSGTVCYVKAHEERRWRYNDPGKHCSGEVTRFFWVDAELAIAISSCEAHGYSWGHPILDAPPALLIERDAQLGA